MLNRIRHPLMNLVVGIMLWSRDTVQMDKPKWVCRPCLWNPWPSHYLMGAYQKKPQSIPTLWYQSSKISPKKGLLGSSICTSQSQRLCWWHHYYLSQCSNPQLRTQRDRLAENKQTNKQTKNSQLGPQAQTWKDVRHWWKENCQKSPLSHFPWFHSKYLVRCLDTC